MRLEGKGTSDHEDERIKGDWKLFAHNFCSPRRRLRAFLAKGNIVKPKTALRQLQLLRRWTLALNTLAKTSEKQNGLRQSILMRRNEITRDLWKTYRNRNLPCNAERLRPFGKCSFTLYKWRMMVFTEGWETTPLIFDTRCSTPWRRSETLIFDWVINGTSLEITVFQRLELVSRSTLFFLFPSNFPHFNFFVSYYYILSRLTCNFEIISNLEKSYKNSKKNS